VLLHCELITETIVIDHENATVLSKENSNFMSLIRMNTYEF